MLKKRELSDCHVLYELMVDPAVFPFVRHKANSVEEFLFLTKQTIEAEENGELISRTILDEWGSPIGTINLFDIESGCGFLGTWIGKPYHGKGYNHPAKEAFFNELFFEKDIQTIFMRIRKTNIRSERAALKIPYVSLANETRPDIYQQLNADGDVYNLFQVERDSYYMHTVREIAQTPVEDTILEA
ncbi:GNAT family N-acetyltransferase [Pseudalkalibacillus berkeleyi]|uniref:GNAT family N-acetyltransferase n=1 Tax=Pseudalkalibacillus berkeleyi TaxID=1069813 RepID=A0ABS9H5Q7_9BACL|nr:GNAT family N-acetyltransferase [Pseudalkalibacillus berkeleyi]MCF6139305.1 GNAT family N-acetyltransferase [Pseudalkalibacillus berkeleyi]